MQGKQRLGSNSSIGIEIFGSILDTEFGNDTAKGIARSKNGVAIGIDIFGKTLINGNEIGDSAIDSGADNDKVIGRGNSRTRTAFGIEINGGKSILVLLMTGLQIMEKVGVVMPMALR